jgi:uncharacterized membrane protein YeaQ/YmgE (transglycosylase-associated protein family)
MDLLIWILLGAIAGFVANLLMGGRTGLIGTILLGIIGAIVGGWLASNVLHVGAVTGLNLPSVVIAVFGAIIVIFLARAFTGRRAAI